MSLLRYVMALTIVSLLVVTPIPGMVHAQTSTWFDELPLELRQSILWYADHESGNLHQWTDEGWEYEGGDIYTTGPADEAFAELTTSFANSGHASVAATIRNAYRAENGSRAVRLMRWTNRAWDDGGQYFPLQAYYSTWVYMPHAYNPTKYAPWDPGDGGWWNIFQFKSNDQHGESQPIWVVNMANDGTSPYLYLYSKYNVPHSYAQADPIPFPVGQWVHLEAYYRQSSTKSGAIRIWQDGHLIFSIENVVTVLANNAVWGIGNYTDHIAGGPVEGEATLYFDDAAVSRKRLSTVHDVQLLAKGSFENATLSPWKLIKPQAKDKIVTLANPANVPHGTKVFRFSGVRKQTVLQQDIARNKPYLNLGGIHAGEVLQLSACVKSTQPSGSPASQLRIVIIFADGTKEVSAPQDLPLNTGGVFDCTPQLQHTVINANQRKIKNVFVRIIHRAPQGGNLLVDKLSLILNPTP